MLHFILSSDALHCRMSLLLMIPTVRSHLASPWILPHTYAQALFPIAETVLCHWTELGQLCASAFWTTLTLVGFFNEVIIHPTLSEPTELHHVIILVIKMIVNISIQVLFICPIIHLFWTHTGRIH